MIDDEDVLIYMMNELVETEKMVNIFKVMMEYEDYPFDFLMDQFLSIIERLDAYSMTNRAAKLNFRKVDAISGEVSELDQYDPESMDYNPWER